MKIPHKWQRVLRALLAGRSFNRFEAEREQLFMLVPQNVRALLVDLEELAELHLHAGDVAIENFLREQLALARFAARVADHAGRATGKRNGMMAEQLKASQPKQRDEIADVQAVGGGIEAGVESERCFFKEFRINELSVQVFRRDERNIQITNSCRAIGD